MWGFSDCLSSNRMKMHSRTTLQHLKLSEWNFGAATNLSVLSALSLLRSLDVEVLAHASACFQVIMPACPSLRSLILSPLDNEEFEVPRFLQTFELKILKRQNPISNVAGLLAFPKLKNVVVVLPNEADTCTLFPALSMLKTLHLYQIAIDESGMWNRCSTDADKVECQFLQYER